eukprot:scaffold318836_cov76-Attheya_sp.AAC.3
MEWVREQSTCFEFSQDDDGISNEFEGIETYVCNEFLPAVFSQRSKIEHSIWNIVMCLPIKKAGLPLALPNPTVISAKNNLLASTLMCGHLVASL